VDGKMDTVSLIQTPVGGEFHHLIASMGEGLFTAATER